MNKHTTILLDPCMWCFTLCWLFFFPPSLAGHSLSLPLYVSKFLHYQTIIYHCHRGPLCIKRSTVVVSTFYTSSYDSTQQENCCDHCANKPVTTMLTYPWKCTVLHCNHLGNTWKPLVLMTQHFGYCPRAIQCKTVHFQG